MAVNVRCPECSSQHRVADERVGSRIRCRDCGCPIQVRRPRSRKRQGPSTATWIVGGASFSIILLIFAIIVFFHAKGQHGLSSSGDSHADVQWAVEPDPAPVSAPVLTAGLLNTPPGTRIKSVAFSSLEAGQAVLNLTLPASGSKTGRLQRVSLRDGPQLSDAPIEIPIRARLLAASPSGEYVAIERERGRPLELWRWTGQQPVKQLDMNVTNAVELAFLSDDTILISRNNDEMLVMNHISKKTLYSTREALTKGKFAVSPGRRYFVGYSRPPGMASEQLRFRVYDSTTGKVAGIFEDPLARISLVQATAFHPDGHRFAAVVMLEAPGKSTANGGTYVLIWDMKTGELEREFVIETRIGNRLQWVNPGYLLFDGALIDLNEENTIWTYKMRGDVLPAVPDHRVWLTLKTEQTTLSAHAVPSDKIIEQIRDVMTRNNPAILKSGESIAIEVRGQGPAEIRDSISSNLSQQLSESGYVINNNAAMKMIAQFGQSSSGGSQTFKDSRGQEVSVPNQRVYCSLSLVDQDGKSKWGDSTSAGVGIVEFIDSSQDVGQQLEQRRWSRIRSWVSGYKFPSVFRERTSKGGAGHSKLSVDGDTEIWTPPIEAGR